MTSTALKVHDANEPRGVAVSTELDYGGLLALARELVPTGFLPDHIKTPGQAVAIILTGREMGMLPMRALRSLTMVKGKVTENADSQLARFKTDGGRATFKVLDETQAVLYVKHPNGDEHTEAFSLEDAKRAGLTGGMGWQKYPKAMLRSRAITAALKSIGWEGGTGTYDPDELSVPDAPGSRNTPERPANVTADGEDLDDMTLETALEVPLRGGPAKWGGNGGKPLREVSLRVIVAALDFFAKKWEESDRFDAALGHQVRALQLVHDFRSFDEKQAGAGAPQDSPEGNELASPSSGPALEIPTIPQLMKHSPTELKAMALKQLEHPSLAMLRAEAMTKIGNGMSKTQYASVIVDQAAIIAGAVRSKDYNHAGTLPGGA